MNRNVETHFAQNPTSIDIQRSQFDRSSSVKLTGNVGNIIPFYLDEVIPGDTFKITTSKVIRFTTMLKPVMDNLYLDTYYFFVPNRLVWDHWKNFCGESAQPWMPTVEYTIPIIKPPVGGFDYGSIADYLGIPPKTTDLPDINALPFRAYAKIIDDWFRSEALQYPQNIYTGDVSVDGHKLSDDAENSANINTYLGGRPYIACKYHDYFTSCLPAPQSGPSVSLGFTGTAPVLTDDTNNKTKYPSLWDRIVSNANPERYIVTDSGTAVQYIKKNTNTGSVSITSSDISGYTGVSPLNLTTYFDNSNASFTINALRTAFQIQKFYEKCARGGRRYIEMIKSQFGVTSPDARLQRSEYLGGNRIPINVTQVTNNAYINNNSVGELGAYSHTSDVSDDFIHSFTEHGYVIGVCVARYDHTYSQGLDRLFSRKTMFDFYWPVFANIGEQPVYKDEIYPTLTGQVRPVFGYQEAWADYRYKPNRVCGEMRPTHPQSLAIWNFADYYRTSPNLSEGWIQEDRSNIDRTLTVGSDVSDQFIADIYIKNICTRPMPMYSVPGLIDHH